ncbi:MAG: biotin/lipoyl-containing protein [Thermodesulfovibrionales bacterium]
MIKQMAHLLSEKGLSELLIEAKDLKIWVERKGPMFPPQPEQIEEAKKTETTALKKEEKHLKSPGVGTFRDSASWKNRPFVKAGDVVEKSKVVCIIEAMKLSNGVEATMNCKIIKCLVENGKPVEYGQPLFLIEELRDEQGDNDGKISANIGSDQT